MPRATILSQDCCDRCKNKIEISRTMSWFNTEILCDKCSSYELDIRGRLFNFTAFEGHSIILVLDKLRLLR